MLTHIEQRPSRNHLLMQHHVGVVKRMKWHRAAQRHVVMGLDGVNLAR